MPIIRVTLPLIKLWYQFSFAAEGSYSYNLQRTKSPPYYSYRRQPLIIQKLTKLTGMTVNSRHDNPIPYKQVIIIIPPLPPPHHNPKATSVLNFHCFAFHFFNSSSSITKGHVSTTRAKQQLGGATLYNVPDIADDDDDSAVKHRH